jgi:hypothetical protein
MRGGHIHDPHDWPCYIERNTLHFVLGRIDIFIINYFLGK